MRQVNTEHEEPFQSCHWKTCEHGPPVRRNVLLEEHSCGLWPFFLHCRRNCLQHIFICFIHCCGAWEQSEWVPNLCCPKTWLPSFSQHWREHEVSLMQWVGVFPSSSLHLVRIEQQDLCFIHCDEKTAQFVPLPYDNITNTLQSGKPCFHMSTLAETFHIFMSSWCAQIKLVCWHCDTWYVAI